MNVTPDTDLSLKDIESLSYLDMVEIYSKRYREWILYPALELVKNYDHCGWAALSAAGSYFTGINSLFELIPRLGVPHPIAYINLKKENIGYLVNGFLFGFNYGDVYLSGDIEEPTVFKDSCLIINPRKLIEAFIDHFNSVTARLKSLDEESTEAQKFKFLFDYKVLAKARREIE
jgi:hypothetical protein